MKLKDFELIANYLNEINRQTFTDAEIKQSAKDYLAEYKASKENGLSTNVMRSLCEELYYDMDFMDYADNSLFLCGAETFKQLDEILKRFVEYIKE